jgi:hypothetical protein
MGGLCSETKVGLDSSRPCYGFWGDNRWELVPGPGGQGFYLRAHACAATANSPFTTEVNRWLAPASNEGAPCQDGQLQLVITDQPAEWMLWDWLDPSR